jgi:esterase/lipase superfamily enzyme
MFIITNRSVDEGDASLGAFKETLNAKGANELRVAEVTRSGSRWSVNVLPDVITPQMARDIGITNPTGPVYASKYVAATLLKRIRSNRPGRPGKNLLFFVHGFNNDIKAVVERAWRFEREYRVEVLVFSWPANGGGARGVIDYKSDKRDARASVGALDRVLGLMHKYLLEANEEGLRRLEAAAAAKFRSNQEARSAYIAEHAHKACPFTVNMLLHSMGNYVYKHVFDSTISNGSKLVFDNVLLVAADVNNNDHQPWVEKIPARRRVYITINEKDAALQASRMKMGAAQQARLGHYRSNLCARNAVYIDVTGATGVGASHAYFEGKVLANAQIRAFFHKAINGEDADSGLHYDVATNLYRMTAKRRAG